MKVFNFRSSRLGRQLGRSRGKTAASTMKITIKNRWLAVAVKAHNAQHRPFPPESIIRLRDHTANLSQLTSALCSLCQLNWAEFQTIIMKKPSLARSSAQTLLTQHLRISRESLWLTKERTNVLTSCRTFASFGQRAGHNS